MTFTTFSCAVTLPVIAVTTTSGTGSQVTQVAVVSDSGERTKSALYHPLLYFPSRPIGESLALLLLALAIYWLDRAGPWFAVLGGAAGGLASLARPNFLLVLLAWAAWAALDRRWKHGLLVLGAAVLVPPLEVPGAWVTVAPGGDGVLLDDSSATEALQARSIAPPRR